jgi:hypothetical protein
VYACPICCSQLAPLRNGTNTRYGWVASPYPTGTSTRQETPSFARRDNVMALIFTLDSFDRLAEQDAACWHLAVSRT